MLVIAVLLPTVDPVSLLFETIPLFVLFELSIWLSVLMERRWERAARPAARDAVIVSADWVLPVDGAADRGRRRRGGRTGGSRRSARPRSSARASGSRARRSCRASSTRTRTSSTRSTPGSATGWRSALARVHIERKRRLGLAEMARDRQARRRGVPRSGITTVGDASFSGAAATACAELGLRAIVYLEVFGRGIEELDERFAPTRDRLEGTLPDRVRLGISPHAPYTCSTELYAACFELGLPVATHLAESADGAGMAARRGRRLGAVRRPPRAAAGHDRDPLARRQRPARRPGHRGPLRPRRR